MITFQEENMIEIRGELEPLIYSHYEEVTVFSESIQFAPAWEVYQLYYDNGLFVFYTVRKDKKLIGYISFSFQTLLHYKYTIIANNDTIFIDRAFRKGLLGYRLIKFAINELKKTPVLNSKVKVINLSCTIEYSLDKIFTRLGFKHTDNLYHLEV